MPDVREYFSRWGSKTSSPETLNWFLRITVYSLGMLQVMGSDGPSVVLATSTEEELAHWMAALCQAAIEEVQTLFHFMLSSFCITLIPLHITTCHSIPFHVSN